MSETFTASEEKYFADRGGSADPADKSPSPAPAAVEAPQRDTVEAPETTDTEAHETEAASDEGADNRRDTKVPLGALDKERAKRRAIETELATVRGEMAGRFAQLENLLRPQQPQQPQQQAPQIPDFNTDPRGHMEARFVAMERQAHEFNQQTAERIRTEQQNHAVNAVVQHANEDEKRFAAITPDYQEATNYLRTQRERELNAQGYHAAATREMIRVETLQLAAGAMHGGRSFAETIYAVAKARGFTAKPAGDDVDDDRLSRINRGQQMAAGVGSAGRAPPASLSRERAANMSDAAFGALSEAQQMKLLGG